MNSIDDEISTLKTEFSKNILGIKNSNPNPKPNTTRSKYDVCWIRKKLHAKPGKIKRSIPINNFNISIESINIFPLRLEILYKEICYLIIIVIKNKNQFNNIEKNEMIATVISIAAKHF